MATPDKAADLQLLGWQYGKSLLQSVRHLFDTRLGADVCFEVRYQRPEGGPQGAEEGSQGAEGDEGGSAPLLSPTLERAHRSILMCRSSVFEQLMGGGRRAGREQHMVDTKEYNSERRAAGHLQRSIEVSLGNLDVFKRKQP